MLGGSWALCAVRLSAVSRTVWDVGTPPTAPAHADAAPAVGDDAAAPAPRAPGLSPSRAADFMTCPLLYRFRVLDRLPEPPSAVATRGTVVHAVLERLFDLDPAERTPERAAGMVADEWARLLEAAPEVADLFPDEPDEPDEPAGREALDGPERPALAAWLDSARALTAAYFALEDPTRLEPRERELYVETTLESGLLLRGYVDRLDVAPSGDMRVVDYKTGRAPREHFEQKAVFQLRFYALVLWRLHGRVPRVLQLLYLGSGEVLRYEPDEADLRATERKLEALWAAIRRATETGDWRASPGRVCEWCHHHALCPAWGGTPPPLPAEPGRDPSPDVESERISPHSPVDDVT